MRARTWLRRREGEEGVSGDAPYRLLLGWVGFSIVGNVQRGFTVDLNRGKGGWVVVFVLGLQKLQGGGRKYLLKGSKSRRNRYLFM